LRLGVGAAVLALGILAATAVAAQSTVPTDTLAEARRLRDTANYSGAAKILAVYVAAHPTDADAARFAALMAYWSKDFAGARAMYGQAFERHGHDADLRVEYAEFLMGVGDLSRAREVIKPLVETGPDSLPLRRRALTTLATLEYWRGDFSRARALLVEKLGLDSTDAEARSRLREIDVASSAWIGAGGTGWHDDQPVDRVGFDVEGGWFATPLTPLSVRVGTTQFSHDDASESVSRAEATISTFFAGPRVDVSLGAGTLNRTFGDASDWTARVSLGFRLPRNLALEGRFERAPYLSTAGSLATPVMTETVDGTLRWRASNGWMADATARRESFEDDNAITTGYVWLLAPLLRRQTGQLHLGYSFSAQAARHSRFVPDPDELDFPPGQAPPTVRGVYMPYYTPRDLRVHSALVVATVRPTTRWSVSTNGTFGVFTHDDAPVLIVVSRPPNADIVRTYYPREYTPWNVRGTIEGAASESIRLAVTAEHGKAAYYSFTTVGARLTYTFVAAARRRADRY
jgi:tetratricopeptide (TPR) repeat protein